MIEFLGYSPSTIAAAAVLCAADKSFDVQTAGGQFLGERVNKVYFLWSGYNFCVLLGLSCKYLLFKRISKDLSSIEICVIKRFPFYFGKEMVRSCHQLMEKYLIDTCPSARLKGLIAQLPATAAAPRSPVGVLDAAACGSCDTRSENPGFSIQAEAGPPAKRLRSSAPDVQ